MSSQKATTEQRLTINREYRTEASKPGGAVLSLKLIMTGGPRYGWMVGVANVARSGVRPPVNDFSGDMPVTGMYAFLGDKQRESISVTLDSPSQSSSGVQTISGQISFANDLKTGFATFTYTSKEDRALTTVENVKISVAKTESY